jgi:glycosyltransferase involved in cell wall biosynthesis
LLHRYFKAKEKKLYAVSDHIGCMSPANIEFLVRNHKEIDPSKVEINPNSILPLEISISETEKRGIKNTYGVPQDAVTFIYGGNLGKPQGIDFLIEILNVNINQPQYFFIIIGDGTEYPKLSAWVINNKPTNVLLLQGLPKNEYDVLLSSCDVGLIFLDKRFTIPNFPSRLLSYLENKMPVIAATDANTDLGKIMTENNFGLWCLNGNISDFNAALVYLQTSRTVRDNMGANGYNFLLKNYMVQQSYQGIVNHFKNV